MLVVIFSFLSYLLIPLFNLKDIILFLSFSLLLIVSLLVKNAHFKKFFITIALLILSSTILFYSFKIKETVYFISSLLVFLGVLCQILASEIRIRQRFLFGFGLILFGFTTMFVIVGQHRINLPFIVISNFSFLYLSILLVLVLDMSSFLRSKCAVFIGLAVPLAFSKAFYFCVLQHNIVHYKKEFHAYFLRHKFLYSSCKSEIDKAFEYFCSRGRFDLISKYLELYEHDSWRFIFYKSILNYIKWGTLGHPDVMNLLKRGLRRFPDNVHLLSVALALNSEPLLFEELIYVNHPIDECKLFNYMLRDAPYLLKWGFKENFLKLIPLLTGIGIKTIPSSLVKLYDWSDSFYLAYMPPKIMRSKYIDLAHKLFEKKHTFYLAYLLNLTLSQEDLMKTPYYNFYGYRRIYRKEGVLNFPPKSRAVWLVFWPGGEGKLELSFIPDYSVENAILEILIDGKKKKIFRFNKSIKNSLEIGIELNKGWHWLDVCRSDVISDFNVLKLKEFYIRKLGGRS